MFKLHLKLSFTSTFRESVKTEDTVPESIEDDRSLVKLISTVKQLSGNDGSITKAGGLAANLFTVQNDVLSMSSEEKQEHHHQHTFVLILHSFFTKALS